MTDASVAKPIVPIARQIACVERELSFRRRVYKSWVARGRMTQAKANEEIAVMEAALATLRAVEKGERLI